MLSLLKIISNHGDGMFSKNNVISTEIALLMHVNSTNASSMLKTCGELNNFMIVV